MKILIGKQMKKQWNITKESNEKKLNEKTKYRKSKEFVWDENKI